MESWLENRGRGICILTTLGRPSKAIRRGENICGNTYNTKDSDYLKVFLSNLLMDTTIYLPSFCDS